MFRTKICGITRVEDAKCVVESGADAIGLNFYPKSSRFIDDQTARRIAEVVHGRIRVIGVFVNETVTRICHLVQYVPLDGVQLHGDESPEFEAELKARLADLEPVQPTPKKESVAVIRAFRCRSSDFNPVRDFLLELKILDAIPDAILLDAFDPNHYGGTGKQLDFKVVSEQIAALDVSLHWLLAGGLTPANVADAIATAQPGGVDTASGVEVESSPRFKDADKVRGFVSAASQAFSRTKS